jgi:hypothetical protein
MSIIADLNKKGNAGVQNFCARKLQRGGFGAAKWQFLLIDTTS